MTEIDFSEMSMEQIESFRNQVVSEIQRRRDEEIELFREKGMAMARVLGMSFDDFINKVAQTKTRHTQAPRRMVPVKFRHQVSGDTWTGRGMMPKWLRREVETGTSIESFRVAV